jgi:hypothetical protein
MNSTHENHNSELEMVIFRIFQCRQMSTPCCVDVVFQALDPGVNCPILWRGEIALVVFITSRIYLLDPAES